MRRQIQQITERIRLRYASPKFPFGELQIRSNRYMQFENLPSRKETVNS